MPAPAPGTRFACYKVSKRLDEDITAVLGAFRLKLGKDGKVSARRASPIGGMAATPKRRARRGGGAASAEPGGDGSRARGDRRLAEDFTPLTDMRASRRVPRSTAAQNLLQALRLETSGGKAPADSRAGAA